MYIYQSKKTSTRSASIAKSSFQLFKKITDTSYTEKDEN